MHFFGLTGPMYMYFYFKAYIKNNIHSVWFPHKILSEVHLNICSRCIEQTTFSGQRMLAG